MKRVLAALAGALMMMLALGAPQVSAAPQGFTAQARAAGLTSAEATALQAEVDRYLTELGGTQTSPNTVDLGNQATLRVAIPGEKHPRDLSGGKAAASPNCHPGGADFYFFCAYSGQDYTGSEIAMGACGLYNIPAAWGWGSWDNNQTDGTEAIMYNSSSHIIFITQPAHSWDFSGDWGPVGKVRNC
ncbi:hypothetical protein ACFYT4_26600 [Streptomyces sp. NPDC004609]|uniref:hypothetical protein n=1 Tax=Streptomyces sp. NPDC004609 TaxID=3364704 RepID=UPI0036C61336